MLLKVCELAQLQALVCLEERCRCGRAEHVWACRVSVLHQHGCAVLPLGCHALGLCFLMLSFSFPSVMTSHFFFFFKLKATFYIIFNSNEDDILLTALIQVHLQLGNVTVLNGHHPSLCFGESFSPH